MKKRCIKITLFGLFLSILLSACGNDPGVQNDQYSTELGKLFFQSAQGQWLSDEIPSNQLGQSSVFLRKQNTPVSWAGFNQCPAADSGSRNVYLTTLVEISESGEMVSLPKIRTPLFVECLLEPQREQLTFDNSGQADPIEIQGQEYTVEFVDQNTIRLDPVL